jgi:C4-dicarboxylate-specific signal transduction histidine kinase
LAWTHAALAATGSAFVCILLVMWNQRRLHLRDRLRAREALQRAHDELERKVEERTRTLRAAQDELVHAGKLAVIGQLSAGLAHEINQPLAALRTLSGNAVKFMRRGNLEAAQGNLDRIGQLVDGMGALTSQLKSFARRSSGAPRPVAVRRSIDNALFLLDQRLRHGERRKIGGASGPSHFEARLNFGYKELTVAGTPNLSTLSPKTPVPPEISEASSAFELSCGNAHR